MAFGDTVRHFALGVCSGARLEGFAILQLRLPENGCFRVLGSLSSDRFRV